MSGAAFQRPQPSSAVEPTIEAPRRPHLHHPHHDHPFSLTEAARQQDEALENARGQALAQLQDSRGRQPGAGQDNAKGQRGTYDTSASGPSFGHILHHNGMPISRHMSMQPSLIEENGPDAHQARERAALSGGPFFRIPFGVPMNANLSRPMMALRTDTGIGMGIGYDAGAVRAMQQGASEYGMDGIGDNPEDPRRRADRSAYVESVEDVSLAARGMLILLRKKNTS